MSENNKNKSVTETSLEPSNKKLKVGDDGGKFRTSMNRVSSVCRTTIDLPVLTGQYTRTPGILVLTSDGEEIPEQLHELLSWHGSLACYIRQHGFPPASQGPLRIRFPGSKEDWELAKNIQRMPDIIVVSNSGEEFAAYSSDLLEILPLTSTSVCGVSSRHVGEPLRVRFPGSSELWKWLKPFLEHYTYDPNDPFTILDALNINRDLGVPFPLKQFDALVSCCQALGVPSGIALCNKMKVRQALVKKETHVMSFQAKNFPRDMRDVIIKVASSRFVDPLSADHLLKAFETKVECFPLGERDLIMECVAFLDPRSAYNLHKAFRPYTRDLVVRPATSDQATTPSLNDCILKWASDLLNKFFRDWTQDLKYLAAGAIDDAARQPIVRLRSNVQEMVKKIVQAKNYRRDLSSLEFTLAMVQLLSLARSSVPGPEATPSLNFQVPYCCREFTFPVRGAAQPIETNAMVVSPDWNPKHFAIVARWESRCLYARFPQHQRPTNDMVVGLLVGVRQEDRQRLLNVGSRLVEEPDQWFWNRTRRSLHLIVTRKQAKEITPEGYPYTSFVDNQNGNDTDLLCFWKLSEEDDDNLRVNRIKSMCEAYRNLTSTQGPIRVDDDESYRRVRLNPFLMGTFSE